MANTGAARPEKAAWGTIYVISDGKGLYKIGITLNWQRRKKQLDVGVKTIEVITENVQYPGRLEKSIHSHFKHRRLPQSEWFKLSKQELDSIIRVISDKGKDYTPVFEKRTQKMLDLEFALQDDPELLTAMLETKSEIEEYRRQRKLEREEKAKRRSGFWGFLG